MVDVGTTITHGSNEYVVDSLMKSGGFGKVFLARQIKPIEREIALKVPADHVRNDPVWSRKFAREARILANISHRNVVKIVAFWTFANGEMALAQELVRGAKPLHEFVAADPTRAASIFVQTLYALRAFHGSERDKSAIHRDLSPANILVDDKGMVKVIDFGLAKEDPRMTEILTRANEGFGTHGCIAPEQMTGAAEVDHRADLFALGRSVTAALQNRHPMHAVPAKLPEPWMSICVKLTEHAPDDRYENAEQALSAAFNGFASHGVALSDFSYHVEEMRFRPIIDGWSEICDLHFRAVPDISQQQIVLASGIQRDVFRSSFDANAFFDKLETGSACATFDADDAGFDDCDPLGEVLVSIYPALTPDRKARCFARLSDVAISYHRYAVMGNVREIFGLEKDPGLRDTIQGILDQRDPKHVIEGRGAIPGR